MGSEFCIAGKKAILERLTKRAWKAALYTSAAELTENTPAYTPIGEVINGSGYITGGLPLTGTTADSGDGMAWLSFDDPVWPDAGFTARYMLIYDASDANRAYALIDFGGNKTGQGGKFFYEASAIIGL